MIYVFALQQQILSIDTCTNGKLGLASSLVSGFKAVGVGSVDRSRRPR
jgi:hypothetical protein